LLELLYVRSQHDHQATGTGAGSFAVTACKAWHRDGSISRTEWNWKDDACPQGAPQAEYGSAGTHPGGAESPLGEVAKGAQEALTSRYGSSVA
jgi:hypothetical protein